MGEGAITYISVLFYDLIMSNYVITLHIPWFEIISFNGGLITLDFPWMNNFDTEIFPTKNISAKNF